MILKWICKKFPSPQEFKEIWQPRRWNRNTKKAKKDLDSLLRFIGEKLRDGESTLGSDAISNNISRRDLGNALAARGWKLRKMSPYNGYIMFYELVPLNSETLEDPPF